MRATLYSTFWGPPYVKDSECSWYGMCNRIAKYQQSRTLMFLYTHTDTWTINMWSDGCVN